MDKETDYMESANGKILNFKDISDFKSNIMKWLKAESKGDLYIWHTESEILMEKFSSCFRVILAAGGLVRNEKGEGLIIFRRGKWDLPKGKAEEGESPEQTALREVEEECNIKGLKIQRFLIITYHIYFIDDIPVLKKTRWFEMKYEGNKTPSPQRKEEITKTVWLPSSDLSLISSNTFQNVLEVIKAGQL